MNGTLVWRAVLIGAAVNALMGILQGFGAGPLFALFGAEHFVVLGFMLRLFSALSDILGGGIAGFVARRDGFLHGALSSLLATLLVTPLSLLRMYAVSRGGTLQLGSNYWIDFGLWVAIGLVLAALAGFLAAELRKKNQG